MEKQKNEHDFKYKNVIIRNAELGDAEKIINAIKEMDRKSIFFCHWR